ncbi:MAG: hypothetical protein ACD_39C00187G0002 [uncultured bacterium]|nr:MAG: hypothetical protein ACD_39C00187G0002 [uncultured bacterium]
MNFHVTEQHKIRRFGLMALLTIFLSISSTAFTGSILRDLTCLEQVIEQTIRRLESDIEFDSKSSDDLVSRASLQLELSALAAGRPDLLEEDYYHLALSLIAEHFGEYATACQLLRKEMKAQTLSAARDWLRKEITELENILKVTSQEQASQNLAPERDYQATLLDLKKTLARAGVR